MIPNQRPPSVPCFISCIIQISTPNLLVKLDCVSRFLLSLTEHHLQMDILTVQKLADTTLATQFGELPLVNVQMCHSRSSDRGGVSKLIF